MGDNLEGVGSPALIEALHAPLHTIERPSRIVLQPKLTKGNKKAQSVQDRLYGMNQHVFYSARSNNGKEPSDCVSPFRPT